MSPLYVIRAASRNAIVTHIIVLRENWIKQCFFVKTPRLKQVTEKTQNSKSVGH